MQVSMHTINKLNTLKNKIYRALPSVFLVQLQGNRYLLDVKVSFNLLQKWMNPIYGDFRAMCIYNHVSSVIIGIRTTAS